LNHYIAQKKALNYKKNIIKSKKKKIYLKNRNYVKHTTKKENIDIYKIKKKDHQANNSIKTSKIYPKLY
jgi:hypothetical protein